MVAVFVAALVVRVALGLALNAVVGGRLFPDEATYTNMARTAAGGETENWDAYTQHLYDVTAAFTWPLTGLFALFGPSRVVAQLFVALLGAGAAAFTTRLALERVSTAYSLFAGAVVAFLPSVVLWSSLTMKDAAVWFLLVAVGLVVAVAARSTGRGLVGLLLVGAALLFLLAYTRQHTFVVATWAFFGALWLAGDRTARLRRGLAATAIWVILPVLGGVGPMGLDLILNPGSLEEKRINNAAFADSAFVHGPLEQEYAEARLEEEDALQDLHALEEARRGLEDLLAPIAPREGDAGAGGDPGAQSAIRQERRLAEIALHELSQAQAEAQRRLEAAQAHAALLAERASQEAVVDTELEDWFVSSFDGSLQGGSSIGRNLKHLPTGLSVMLVRPFPWSDAASPGVRMAQIETVFWYPLLLLALVGLGSSWRARRILCYPLLFGGAILLTYALVEGNFGTAFRHRAEFVWVVALFAAFGVRSIWMSVRIRRANRELPDTASRPDVGMES